MRPTDFAEANLTLTAPPGMGEDKCEPLRVCSTSAPYADGTVLPVVVSCWELSDEDLAALAKSRRLWLLVWGSSMPPVRLDVETPFVPVVLDGNALATTYDPTERKDGRR